MSEEQPKKDGLEKIIEENLEKSVNIIELVTPDPRLMSWFTKMSTEYNFEGPVTQNIEKIISEDPRLIFWLNRKNYIIRASKAVLDAIKYETPEELNMCSLTWAKRRLNGKINGLRNNGKIEVIFMDKLMVPTYNLKELTLFNLGLNVYNFVTTVEITHAETKELKDSAPWEYVFDAPTYLDTIGTENLVHKSKMFARDVIVCGSHKKKDDVLKIDMSRVEHLGDLNQIFTELILYEQPNIKFYKPSQYVYEKLIAAKVPIEKIENYTV